MSESELRLISSESVTEGHPDKVCDQVSDAILDALLEVDDQSLTAVETVATRGLVHVVGEIKTEGYVEIPQIVRDVITGIGYTSSDVGFDGRSCGVSLSIGQQSQEIRDGVLTSYEVRELGSTDPFDRQGAGDQGIMFGYATDETPELMPAPIAMAHKLTRRLAELRHSGELPWLRPDGKAQVTLGYEGAVPRTVDAVVVSTQHDPDRTTAEIHEAVRRHVIDPVLADSGLDAAGMTAYINPSGSFVEGGPGSDAGLTGRKIIVDTYGGAAHHGGGAFSGKDPSKVDRSAAYALRHAAKNAVAAGLAKRLEIQVAYAIGKARPVGLYADSFGTGTLGSDRRIADALLEVFDLRPEAILENLELRQPVYQRTAAYGHFGRDEPGFTWERLDKVDQLREAAGL